MAQVPSRVLKSAEDRVPRQQLLIVTDSLGSGKPLALFVVSHETGERRQLTNPQPPAAGDAHPAVPERQVAGFPPVP